jgi:hypothetical protein
MFSSPLQATVVVRRSAVEGRTASTGHHRCTLQTTGTTCTSTVQVSFLRMATLGTTASRFELFSKIIIKKYNMLGLIRELL